MPMQDYIDVRVLVDGEPAQEYRGANAHNDGLRTETRYIESEIGKQFSVDIRLLAGFDVRYARSLYAETAIDDMDCSWSSGGFTDELDVYHRLLSSDYSFSTLDENTSYDESKRSWVATAFEFGALETTQEEDMTSLVQADRASDIGSIRVKFYRAKQWKEKKVSAPYSVCPIVHDEVPERLVKGKDVKNNTRLIIKRTIPSPQSTDYSWEYAPVKGKDGKPYEFIFLYRDKKCLRNLGFDVPDSTPIPSSDIELLRSVSPTAEMSSQLNLVEDMMHRAKKEFKRATADRAADRAQFGRLIGRLEKLMSGTVLYTPSSTRAGSPAPSDTFTNANTEADLKEIAAPLKPAPVVIDLTDDD